MVWIECTSCYCPGYGSKSMCGVCVGRGEGGGKGGRSSRESVFGKRLPLPNTEFQQGNHNICQLSHESSYCQLLRHSRATKGKHHYPSLSVSLHSRANPCFF